ncbi:MAG: hypothetical protein L0206_12850 [Actinobacteria bacterium]|nr:hypothetical protein [Actinomycetota bacterium]
MAGSIDRTGPPISRVVVIDAAGRRAEMAPNPYGNYFRHLSLEPPLQAEVHGPDGTTLRMKALAPHGSCNRCHRPGGEAPPVRGP